MSSPSFNEKTTVGFEWGGGVMVLLRSMPFYRQSPVGVGGGGGVILTTDLFISCHVLGSIDVMLRFIHAVGSLKLTVLVPVHACTQQIILVFACGMYPLEHKICGT